MTGRSPSGQSAPVARPDVTRRSRRKSRQTATMNDVAHLARVSPMTVSRVLNRIPSVAPEKRRSVLEAIRILNYSPSDAARHLAGGRAHRIAVPYGNPSGGYMSEFLLGA